MTDHAGDNPPSTMAEHARYAGWSAYASALAAVLGLVFFAAFLAAGAPFGTLADGAGVVLGVSLVPVAWALHRRFRRDAPTASRLAVTVGSSGMTLLALSSFGLLVGAPGRGLLAAGALETTAVVANGVVGCWLLLVASLAVSRGVLPRRLVWLGALAGVGYVALALGFLLGGADHPVTALAGVGAVVVYAAWAGSLGRRLLGDDPTASPSDSEGVAAHT